MRTAKLLSIHAGRLRMDLDGTGHIRALTDMVTGRDYLFRKRGSALLTLRVFGDKLIRKPIRLRRLDSGVTRDGQLRLSLAYADGVTLELAVTPGCGYARMTITAARDKTGANPVEVAYWGPWLTDMRHIAGEIIGVIRSGDFSIGLLSLEPNTEGVMGRNRYEYFVAHYLDDGEGSYLHAEARDHTRDGIGENQIAIHGEPGRTVIGSAVALFGCVPEDELDIIETVELTEGLPHPLIDGQWSKRSPHSVSPGLWVSFDESTASDCIEMARRMGATTLSSYHDMFGNWGHFDPDPKAWPSGFEGLRKTARQAQAAGVSLAMYTLTTFLKPRTMAEPFIAPVPDSRLQFMGKPTSLAKAVEAGGATIALERRDGLLNTLRILFKFDSWLEHYDENQVVRIDDEIVYYRSVRAKGTTLILEGCRRGLFDTRAVAHERGARVVRLYLNVYRNFYPGTLEMQDEVCRKMAEAAIAGDFGEIFIDGHESCLETGHGTYSRNLFTQRLYDRCAKSIPIYAGSQLGNHDWHVITYTSWGEGDRTKGFRGTMLDYRLMRQVQLRRNLMPQKLGQYYPDDATLEDVEWLMALATGWNAGIDYHVWADFTKNPQREAILDATRLWNAARIEKAFSEAQLLAMRQTDRLYSLARGRKGTWKLTYKGRWMHKGVQMIPPAAFKVEAAASSAAVAGCSIDWSWTHNPCIYARAGLSDDLVYRTGTKTGAWAVRYPRAEREETDRLQFVLRLADDASCAIRNPTLWLDDDTRLVIPAVLQPGQYLSTTHNTPLACIYDAQHEVIEEVHLRGRLFELPAVSRKSAHRIRLSAEPVAKGGNVSLILNLRTHEEIR